MGTGGGNIPMVMEPTVFSKSKRAQNPTDYETWTESDTANTLNTFDQGDVRTNECVIALDRASYNQGKNAQFDIGINESGTAQSLVAKGPRAVCYSFDPLSSNSMKSPNPHSGCHQTDVARTIDTSYYKGCGMRQGVEREVVRTRYTVRRLTPLECERLQGYPDGWTDIGEYIDSNGKKKQSSDAARYKALGNSIALPPWKWVMKRLCACYERDATLASLFDGIGGFPLIWEQINGKGSCLWASEIEEFPIAVTKVRIGE
jgi:DNA (cytosine-5)-methyltransferase 1